MGSRTGKKQPRKGAIVEQNRPRLDSLQRALRELMTRYGDTRTEVRYLQDANDSNELRWECRNTGERPCRLLTISERPSQQSRQ